ncbi:MAG: 4-hydroxy-tetrahydrodipicolinate reductase [Chlamydiae bacterium]|nr:4-hydroxy-tetrahydrodipicolinate reductase [Chlamydiota bacterium]
MRIALIGKSGKMGKVLAELIEEDPTLSLSDDPSDVVIDFSSPEGTLAAIALDKPLVCGTTGLSEETMELLKDLSLRVPVLYSPNFSLAVAALFEICEGIGCKLATLGETTIEEIHHTEKKDSPSGTALKLAALLKIDPTLITAKREGSTTGIHKLKFLLNDEELEIRYEAYSRKAYARGALAAAKFIYQKPPGFYPLNQIFH